MATIAVFLFLLVTAAQGAELEEQVVRNVSRDETDLPRFIENRTPELENSALVNALSGYDIVHGEPYIVTGDVTVDPGMKHQIFVKSDQVEIRKITNCAAETRAHIVTTVEQFRQVTGSTSVKGSGVGFEKKGEVGVEAGPVSVSGEWEVSASVAFSNSKSSQDVVEYLTKSRGALAMVSASCLLDQVSFTEYAIPPFSIAFTKGLQALDSATKDPPSRASAFRKFANTFGTHYVQKASLGARLMMTMFLTEKARRDFERDTMKECSSKSAQFNFFGAKFGSDSKKCSSSDAAMLNNDESYVYKTVKRTYGSTLAKAVEDWANKDFDPMPIQRVLRPINRLFSDKVLKNAGVKIDGRGLRAWFNPLYEDYCRTMSLPCGTGKKSGCGINDNCRLEQACLDKENGEFSCIADCPFIAGWPLKRWDAQISPLWEGKTGDATQLSLACVEACVKLKKTRPEINGVSVQNDGSACWCQSYLYGPLTTIGSTMRQRKTCQLRNLQVDGHWSSWSSYSSCSASCGKEGIRTSHRTCNSPAPKNNGKGCPPATTFRSLPCNRKVCKCKVEFYDHPNYNGGKQTYWADTPEVTKHDTMSSLKITPLCCVTVYEHSNFGGKHYKFCENTPHAEHDGIYAADILSSSKLEHEPYTRAIGGRGGDSYCYFPFTYKYIKRSACIVDETDNQLWCYTTQSGYEWGYCLETAPTIVKPYTFPVIQTLRKNHLLTTITKLSPSYTVEFEFYPIRFMFFRSVLLMTATGRRTDCCAAILAQRRCSCSYGDQTPAVKYFNQRLKICSAVSGDRDFCRQSAEVVPMARWTKVVISQRGDVFQYIYEVKVGGEVLVRIENTQPRTFYNVKVYAANPWNTPADAYIRNLVISPFEGKEH